MKAYSRGIYCLLLHLHFNKSSINKNLWITFPIYFLLRLLYNKYLDYPKNNLNLKFQVMASLKEPVTCCLSDKFLIDKAYMLKIRIWVFQFLRNLWKIKAKWVEYWPSKKSLIWNCLKAKAKGQNQLDRRLFPSPLFLSSLINSPLLHLPFLKFLLFYPLCPKKLILIWLSLSVLSRITTRLWEIDLAELSNPKNK